MDDPWSSSGRGRRIASPARYTRPRGIPGPSRPCHGHRSPRRLERRRPDDARCRGSARRRGSHAPARLPAAGQHRRRRDRDASSWAGPSSRCVRRSIPAATSARSTSWSSIPDHDAERITEALVDELLRSASNKGCTVVETVRPDDPAARARLEGMGFDAAGPRLQRIVTAAGAAGASHLMNHPAVQRDRAGRADP